MKQTAPLEPDLSTGEASLQEAVAAEIRYILTAAGLRYLPVERFGLDIAVWIERGDQISTRFMELKVFTGARQGGVGFGNGQGKGSQVDILIQNEPDLALLERSVRWIVADATLPSGTARFMIVPSTVAKGAAMGGAARGKQNNLRMSTLGLHALTWSSFCQELRQFLLD